MTFVHIYKTIILPPLEYCHHVWYPVGVEAAHAFERVQRRATKILPGFRDLPYSERLTRLRLPSLYFRRLRGDMIEMYKFTHNHYPNFDLFHATPPNRPALRQHPFYVFKPRCNSSTYLNFFSIRALNTWNGLPSEVVCVLDLNKFKHELDKFWVGHPLMYASRQP
jgi:hypothetical protein